MLSYNSPIIYSKEYSDIKISVVEPSAKINLRGKSRDFITKIGKELSIIPPSDPNSSSGNDSLNILWLSPDEWLIYSNNEIEQNYIYELEDKLYNSISKLKVGSVTNVSDHWIMLNLRGNKVFELLSTGCPFNFNKFKDTKGAVTQTLINHIDVIIHNKNNNNLNMFVRRSFSEHLMSWMNDSARFI